ncbi:EAL domain-containing protein [Thiocystis violascens]|uniref:cyclic-guanylate-specific phosphodiesterase n=1 Tax=Thiocystis violascens (strain ATCC 17096 / DSM 198 / 6111) TaxID=765911 RepID=I3YD08_THIV6|nr:EAL domain-containing protein [Thiocystis violascens]AFL74876.1 PAS domain S-box/diguanylate cyclase (GGDEF) domain-containing protein [Thiocystis violascens DSM 198]
MTRQKTGVREGQGSIRDLIDISPEELRARALTALQQGRFDLADEVLAGSDLKVAALVENLRIYQAELEIQNEELLHSQRRSEESLARFTAFFDGLPVAELVIDRTGLVKESNLAAQRLFNLRDSHFHQHFFARLIVEADRGAVIGAWSKLSGNQTVVIPEVRFRGDGTGEFIGDLHFAPLPRTEDEAPQFVCAVIDRTEAVQQRRDLFEAGERLFRSEAELKERLKELACLHDVLAATSQADAPVARIIRQVVERLPAAWRFADLAEARIYLPHISVETAGFAMTDWSLTAPIALADGRQGEITVVYRAQPHGDDDGEEQAIFLPEERSLLDAVATHVAVFLDRHDDEERLRDSRERYRVLAEYSPDWEYWLGPDGQYRYVSPACLKLTGYPPEGFIDDPDLFTHLIHPADRELWVGHCRELASSTVEHVGCVEFRIFARDGQERWIEHICNPVVTDDGRYLGRRGVNRDITQRKRFEEALRRSEDFLNATGRMAKVGGWELDPVTNAMRWTSVTYEIFEVDPGGAPSFESGMKFFHPSDRVKLQKFMDLAISLGQPFDIQARLVTTNDRPLWVQVACEPVMHHGVATKLLGTIQDITARMDADKSLRQAARVFENTAEGVVITDPEERILAVNRAFAEITGYAEEEVLGATPRILNSGRHDAEFYQAMWAELNRSGQWRGELWNRHKNGQIYPELMTISAVVDGNGELTHYVGVFRDISHLKRSEEKLEYLAHHDPLTGLPNRSLFQARLEQCLQRAARHQRQVGLLFLDLDRFKIVNDTLGHSIGDGLLQQVAETLSKQVRAADTIARLGGDEFVIILEDIPAARFAANFAERLMTAFSQPFNVEGHELFITASMGISLYPQDGEEIDALVRHADIAMYQSKNGGRNGFSFFESAMTEGAAERLRLEHDLHGALLRDEFVLHYHPQLALADGQLRGVEALCRWQHPTLGLIPPNQFIPVAEDIGLIDRLGAWVLEESCRQMIVWDQAGFHVPRLAVNLSVRELERADLVDEIREILHRTGVAPERLELEVTESMIMRNAELAIKTLAALRGLGVTLAVDDFGTGYSSLAYLKRLPLHRLKIDRSFVEKLTQDSNDDAIVRAILALGRSLGLETLAEGVETQAQVDFLLQEGCIEGQGYLFSRPVPAADLVATLF